MCKDAGIDAGNQAEMELDYRTGCALSDTVTELEGAMAHHPTFNSAHEGFAVLLEEVDELKEHVWKKQGSRDITAMRKEAVQVAAMALRFIADICHDERGQS